MLCFLIAIKSGQIITTLFSHPNEITSKSYRIRYDVIKIDIVIIEHHHNRLVTAVHKIHIVLIKYQTVTIIVKMKHA
jgi:hypothetical protein